MENIINTSTDTYLVTFQNSTSQKFIVSFSHIAEVLKKLDDGYYLANIHRFDNTKLKFDRVAKSYYKTLFGWNAEAMDLFKKHNIIK